MNDASSVSQPAGERLRTRSFSEDSFYLEEFYGKSLLFAMVPPAGPRISDFNSLLHTLRHLKTNQTRCIVIVSQSALPKLLRRMGRLAPSGPVPVFNPSIGVRSRPYPPDGAVTQIWEGLRAGSIVIAVVFSVWPAIRAAWLRPVQALRYE